MARVKGAMMTRKRRNKKLGLAKGYWGNKSRHYKMANQQLMKSGRYAYVGRKLKKRDYRGLWQTRIAAAAKMSGTSYSRLIGDLKKKGSELDRKVLADLAANHPADFAAIVEWAKAA